MPLPIGTIRFNQAAGLRWFTVALRIKIGCKELTLLGSTATQLQVMLCVCVCVCVCARALTKTYISVLSLKGLPQYVFDGNVLSALCFYKYLHIAEGLKSSTSEYVCLHVWVCVCVCVCVCVSVCGWFVVEPERRISIKRLTGFI